MGYDFLHITPLIKQINAKLDLNTGCNELCLLQLACPAERADEAC